MKHLNTLTLLLFAAIIMSACSEDQVGPVLNPTPGAPVISAPSSGQTYELSEETAADTVLRMKWSEPDYGFSSAVHYSLQLGMKGNAFENATEIATTTKETYSFTGGALNNLLLSLGLPFGQKSMVQVRVVASLSDSLQKQVSEPVTLGFIPYEVIIVYPEIYVPGSYQSASGYTANWSPADAPALESVNSDGKYEGYVYIAEDNSFFKFTDERDWDLNWGDTGADGSLEENGTNIGPVGAGYYKMNVDLNSLSYSLLKTSWGIIGSATPTGWDSDTDMVYHSDTKVWTISMNLTAGEIKFRANDAWDLNYGDNEGDGHLEAGGSNIKVEEAGNYTITLDLSDAPYSYMLKKNE